MANGYKRVIFREYGVMHTFRIPECVTDYTFDEKWDIENEKLVVLHMIFVLNGRLVWQREEFVYGKIVRVKNAKAKRLNLHMKYKHFNSPRHINRYIGMMDDDYRLHHVTQTTKFCPHCMKETSCFVEKRKEKYNWKNEGDIEILADVVVCGKCGKDIWDDYYDGKNIDKIKTIYERRKNRV